MVLFFARACFRFLIPSEQQTSLGVPTARAPSAPAVLSADDDNGANEGVVVRLVVKEDMLAVRF